MLDISADPWKQTLTAGAGMFAKRQQRTSQQTNFDVNQVTSAADVKWCPHPKGRQGMSPEEIVVARRRYFDWTWRRGLAALKQFKAREGHSRVPRHYIEGTYRLGQWVAVQRYYCITGVIAPARKAQLDTLGFVWSRRDWLWETGFAALKAFRAREGHCRVGALHIEGDFKLGFWVSTQRRKKNQMVSVPALSH